LQEQNKSLNIQQIIREKPIKIKSHAERDAVEIRAAIIQVIAKSVLTLAPFKQPTPEQIGFFADMIISDYGQLSLDDLQLCMLNGLKGLYGAKKGEHDNIISFDSEVMLRWLQKYGEEKRTVEQNYNVSSNQFPTKKNYEPSKMPIEIKESLTKMFKKAGIDKPFNRHEKAKSIVVKDWRKLVPGMDEEVYKIWEWFDEQWNEQGCPLLNGSTDQIIEYNDKNYTRGEFTKYAQSLNK